MPFFWLVTDAKRILGLRALCNIGIHLKNIIEHTHAKIEHQMS